MILMVGLLLRLARRNSIGPLHPAGDSWGSCSMSAPTWRALGTSRSVSVVLAAWARAGVFTHLDLTMLPHFEDG